MPYQTLLDYQDEVFNVWLGYDASRNHYCFEGFLKQETGIKHLVWGSATPIDPDATRLGRLTDLHGVFSPRPYRLGGAGDGSIGTVTMALYHRFCADNDFDAAALYAAAYRQEAYWFTHSCQQFADWQGVRYPRQWRTLEQAELLNSLTHINYHRLREVVKGVELTIGSTPFTGLPLIHHPKFLL